MKKLKEEKLDLDLICTGTIYVITSNAKSAVLGFPQTQKSYARIVSSEANHVFDAGTTLRMRAWDNLQGVDIFFTHITGKEAYCSAYGFDMNDYLLARQKALSLGQNEIYLPTYQVQKALRFDEMHDMERTDVLSYIQEEKDRLGQIEFHEQITKEFRASLDKKFPYRAELTANTAKVIQLRPAARHG